MARCQNQVQANPTGFFVGHTATAAYDGYFYAIFRPRLKRTIPKFTISSLRVFRAVTLEYLFFRVNQFREQHGEQRSDYQKDLFSASGYTGIFHSGGFF